MSNFIKTFEGYQNATAEFNVFDEGCDRFLDLPRAQQKEILRAVYCLIGAAGEIGEALNKIKKVLRGDYTLDEVVSALQEETGDSLWYHSELHNVIGWVLGDTAGQNIAKLTSRKTKGTLQGSGDNR